jgi:hypothetical protein
MHVTPGLFDKENRSSPVWQGESFLRFYVLEQLDGGRESCAVESTTAINITTSKLVAVNKIALSRKL